MTTRKSTKDVAAEATSEAATGTRNRTMNSYFAPKAKSAESSASTSATSASARATSKEKGKEKAKEEESKHASQVKASPKATRSAPKPSNGSDDVSMTDVSDKPATKQKPFSATAAPRSPTTRTKRQASIESDPSSVLEMHDSPRQSSRNKKQKLETDGESKLSSQPSVTIESTEKLFAALADSSDSSDSEDDSDDDISSSRKRKLQASKKKQTAPVAASSPPKTHPITTAAKSTKPLQQRTLAASASGTLTTVKKHEDEFIGEDPAVILSNLLTISREMHEFRELFRDKMTLLKQILLDGHIQSWNVTLLVQVVAQLLAAWMHALPTSRAEELTYHTAGDPSKRNWHTSHVPLFVNVLQILTQKLHEVIQNAANGEVQAVAEDSKSSSKLRPPPNSQSHFTPIAVTASIQILHLCEARFSLPQFWGSTVSVPSTPSEMQSSHFLFFGACCEWLHATLPHLVPLLAEPEKERLRKWLLHIATRDMKQQLTHDEPCTRAWHSSAVWSAKQRLHGSKSEDHSTDTISSSLPCCSTCSSSKHHTSHFPPSLSLAVRASLLIFQQSYEKEKFSIESANTLSNLISSEFFEKDALAHFPLTNYEKESVHSSVMKLSFLRSISSPPFRLYCTVLASVQLLNPKEGLAFILAESHAKDAFISDGNRLQSHSMLVAQLTLLHEVVLQSLTHGYQRDARAEQGRLSTAASSRKFAEKELESIVSWGPKREAAVNANKNLTHTKPTRPSPSIATAFARQAVNQAEKVTLASMSKKEKEALERQRDEEIAAKKKEATEATQQTADAKTEEFLELQQQYSHLLSIILDTINEQMHQHIDECKSTSELKRNTSTTSIVSATAVSRQASMDIIVPDSQPSNSDAGASSTDADASQSSNRSKKEKKEPSSCLCHIDSQAVCAELKELYHKVHTQIHHMQGQLVVNKKL